MVAKRSFPVNYTSMGRKKPDNLSFVKPRDTSRARARSAAYSRMVGFLRWVLPSLVLLVFAALVLWPMLRFEKITAPIAGHVPNLVVEKLNLTGLDAKNQPYSITAERALQAMGSRNVIELEKPQGDIALDTGSWLTGRAERGRYDQLNKRLWLGGDVRLFHDRGYEFSTGEVNVDMGRNIAWGDLPVLLQGQFGEIRGEGFRVLNRGNVVVITGRASATLDLRGTPVSDKPLKVNQNAAAAAGEKGN